VIAAFKTYYGRRTFIGLLNEMEKESSLTVSQSWKNYNIAGIRRVGENCGPKWLMIEESPI
jgi:hypothetical protein